MIHCWEEGCIVTIYYRGRDVLENTPPEAISRAEGCKLPRGVYFPVHPDSRQCIAILFSRDWKLHLK